MAVALVSAACGDSDDDGGASPTTSPPDDTVTDVATLTEGLLAAGASVEAGGNVSQPFFPVDADLIVVNGEDVQVFVYADAAAADSEAQAISPDGHSIGDGLSTVTWCSIPHFFGANRLIVLYVGDTPAMTELLEGVLGQEFAGGWVPPTPCPGF
jgi:hypothetical protein